MDGDTEIVRRVFISYAHADAAFSDAFAGTLSTFGLNVWKDDKDIPIGDNILKSVYAGIRTSSHFCCILSASSIKSAWVEEELSFAKMRQLEHKTLKIVPVLIDAVAIPDYLQAYLCAHLENRELSIKNKEFLRILKAFGTDLTEYHKQVLLGTDRTRMLDACENVRERLVPFRELLSNYQRAEDAIKSAQANRGYDNPREFGGGDGRIGATTFGSDYLIEQATDTASDVLRSLKNFARDLGKAIANLEAVWLQVDPGHSIASLRVTLSGDLNLASYMTTTISGSGERADAKWWVQGKLRPWLGDVPKIEGAVESAITLLREWAAFEPEEAVE